MGDLWILNHINLYNNGKTLKTTEIKFIKVLFQWKYIFKILSGKFIENIHKNLHYPETFYVTKFLQMVQLFFLILSVLYKELFMISLVPSTTFFCAKTCCINF